jgi:flagellar protein FliS
MFQTLSNAKAAYEKVGLDMGVETASPHKLILMLYDGALKQLSIAQACLANGDKSAMSDAIVKASNIIALGLRDSVDPASGGDLAVRLSALYDYMNVRLQFANIKANAATIQEVCGLLLELRGAWEEIGKVPAPVSGDKAAA